MSSWKYLIPMPYQNSNNFVGWMKAVGRIHRVLGDTTLRVFYPHYICFTFEVKME